MKACSICKSVLPLDEFYKRPQRGSGLYSECKSCHKAKGLAYRNKNRPAIAKRSREYADQYRQRKPHVCAMNRAARKSRQSTGTPKWANRFIIREIYDLARRRTLATGFAWHVDHIVPLLGKLVSGLHVENNLRVIPGAINVAKGNTYREFQETKRL